MSALHYSRVSLCLLIDTLSVSTLISLERPQLPATFHRRRYGKYSFRAINIEKRVDDYLQVNTNVNFFIQLFITGSSVNKIQQRSEAVISLMTRALAQHLAQYLTPLN